MLEEFVKGLFFSIHPIPLFYITIGVAWGIIGGAIPGISPSIAIVLVLPLTYYMDATIAIILLAAVYTGACYGSSIPAILIGTPGAPASAATVVDGYELGKKGYSLEALGISLTSGVIGGLIGTILLTIFVIPLGKVALAFGPPEYFAVCIFGLSIVASIGSGSQLKAFISVIIGLAIATIGLDPFSGVQRFTLGIRDLGDGVNIVSAMIGLFAIGEFLNEILNKSEYKKIEKAVKMKLPWALIKKHLKLTCKSGIIGTFVGALPGAGATLSGFVAYSEAKRTSKSPELFGSGSYEGVAAPEAANNANVSGSLVPLLALGVPGSSAAAMILAALIMHGISPGPVLFRDNPGIVYSVFAGLFIAQLMLFVVGYLFIKPFIKIVDIDKSVLNSIIMVLVLIGSFSLTNNIFDPMIAIVFGIIGLWVRRNGYSSAAIVLGLVLGELVETSFRRSLILSRGSLGIFITRPISLALIILAVLSTVVGIYKSRKALRTS